MSDLCMLVYSQMTVQLKSVADKGLFFPILRGGDGHGPALAENHPGEPRSEGEDRAQPAVQWTAPGDHLWKVPQSVHLQNRKLSIEQKEKMS